MTAITTSWGDIQKEIRKYIVKEGPTAYELYTVLVGGTARKATPAEVKARAEYLKGPDLGFLCIHTEQVRGPLLTNLIS